MDHESLKQIPQNSNQIQNEAGTSNKTLIPVKQIKKCHKMRGPPKGSKRRPNLSVGIKSGLWNINEMKAYLKFITRFESHFQDKATRKKKKIFHRMSNFIKSRTAEQCRSHHQKLEIKYETHEKIIEFIESEIARIIEFVRKGLLEKEAKFQAEQKEGVKLEDEELSVRGQRSQKMVEKRTGMQLAEPYDVELIRNRLIINIDEQEMQIWR